MRNWGTAVTAFYILIVAGLSPAVVILAVEIGDRPPTEWFSHIYWRDLTSWEYWVWVMLLAGGPLVLLLIHVGMPREAVKAPPSYSCRRRGGRAGPGAACHCGGSSVVRAIDVVVLFLQRLLVGPSLDLARLLAAVDACALADGRTPPRSGGAYLSPARRG